MNKFCFYSQKGGVGKSTLTFNVGYELAKLGKKVLIVDADPQGNLSATAANNFERTISNVLVKDASLGLAPCSAADAIHETQWKNLSIIPADRNLAIVGTWLSSSATGITRMKNTISSITHFDFMLIDSSPTNSLLSWSAISCINSVIIPVCAGFYEVLGIGKTLQTVTELNTDLGLDIKMAGLVLNRWTKNKVAKQLAASLEHDHPNKILGTIPEGVKVAEASCRQLPMGLYASDSPIYESIQSLTKRIMQWHQIKKVA